MDLPMIESSPDRFRRMFLVMESEIEPAASVVRLVNLPRVGS